MSSIPSILILIIILFSLLKYHINCFLLWPQFSVLQITSAFSVPVEIPHRKLFFDWGFQMNYDLPYNVSSFYNVPIWPGFSKRSIIDYSNNDIILNPYEKYLPSSSSSFTINRNNNNNNITKFIHPSDLTAGEFYTVIEDLLIQFGYDDTCLLKSVCENAKHPFDMNNENLFVEIINFILSPTMHDAFGENELEYKISYENAELYGFSGQNCNILYPKCKQSILNLISKIIYEEE